MSPGFSAFNNEARREFGVKVRAFWREQNAPARVVLDSVDFNRFHQQNGLPFGRFGSIANSLNPGLADHLPTQSGELTLSRFARDFETLQRFPVNEKPEARGAGRSLLTERVEVGDQLQCRQAQSARVGDQAVRGKGAERFVPKLNRSHVPSGGKPVMPVGQKKRLSLEGGLYLANRRRVSNWPDPVLSARAIARRFQKPGHHPRFVMTPEPQAAGIGTAGGNGFGAGGDTLRRGFFVRENRCFFAIKQPHHAISSRFTDLLPVQKQCRFLQFGKARGVENFRRLLARDIDCIGRRIPRAEGQQNWHANEPARIAGMAS